MHKSISILLALSVAALLAGCEGTGPSTQNGAVAGGVLGALAGGIIGNNHGGQTWQGAAIGGVAGALIGGSIGNSIDHQNGTIYHSEAEATSNVVVQQVPPPPPPPPPEATGPQPTPSAIWIPGFYAFNGSQYAWVAGHWEIPPPQAVVYVRPHWVYRGGNYVFIRGYWRS